MTSCPQNQHARQESKLFSTRFPVEIAIVTARHKLSRATYFVALLKVIGRRSLQSFRGCAGFVSSIFAFGVGSRRFAIAAVSYLSFCHMKMVAKR